MKWNTNVDITGNQSQFKSWYFYRTNRTQPTPSSGFHVALEPEGCYMCLWRNWFAQSQHWFWLDLCPWV